MEQELRKLDVEGLGDEIEEESTSEPQTRLNFCNKLFESMKQVTGLSELPQIVKRFEDQQETSTQLGLLRAHNDNELKRLKNQSTELKQHLATIRTAYEERKERQKSLEADRQKLLVEQQRKLKELKDTVDVVEKQLTRVHLVIEHLYTKLCLVRMATKRDRAYSTVRAKELLLDLTTEDLLERCLELQQQLQTDLEDYDMFDEEEKLDEAMSESLRTRDEYQVTVERRVPINAARIEIPNKDIAFADEPGEGDQDVLTREALKQRSRMIVEHAKRKVTRNSRNRRQANPLN
ncbi:hypothetical protein AHF37_01870 [Paragonimus kellicotti]|nr:hypothetical protein AHF37_01870 [Paragonimus kellicotti]